MQVDFRVQDTVFAEATGRTRPQLAFLAGLWANETSPQQLRHLGELPKAGDMEKRLDLERKWRGAACSSFASLRRAFSECANLFGELETRLWHSRWRRVVPTQGPRVKGFHESRQAECVEALGTAVEKPRFVIVELRREENQLLRALRGLNRA